MFEQEELMKMIEDYKEVLEAGEKVTVKLNDGYFYILKEEKYSIVIELFDEKIDATIAELFPNSIRQQELEK